ncbi:MAG: exonuclease domain-containing protein [Bacilli bacterium]|nr:exonuclease domain-containing protein [Bacilli bacterium]
MKIYGKLIKTYQKERVIKLLNKNKIYYLYMSRKFFKDFGPYFYNKPYLFVNISEDKKKYGEFFCNDIISFDKVVEGRIKERKVYYNIDTIRKGVRRLIDNDKYKLFLDLEFSLPSYYQTKVHIPEIVQYGIVLEDPEGNIILEDGRLVNPLRKYALNLRTYKFLKKSKEDFEDACSYIEFYQLLEKIIDDYDVKIIAWGRNDILTMEQSFKLNRLKPLDIRNRYMNLMQVVKNYYNSKADLGLFNTYEEMSGTDASDQSHDALEDALMTREIYRMFKQTVISEVEI